MDDDNEIDGAEVFSYVFGTLYIAGYVGGLAWWIMQLVEAM